MPFQPSIPLLSHARPDTTDAHVWLMGLMGDTPWTDARATLHSPNLPVWVAAKKGKPDTWPVHGPVDLMWGNRRVFIWRDQSAVIMDQVCDGWSVWPAVFALNSQILAHGFEAIPYLERPHKVASLRTRSDAHGLLWEVSAPEGAIHDDTNATILSLIAQAADALVEEVRAAPPILDPRAHTSAAGGRFAPFSRFPASCTVNGEDITTILAAAAKVANLSSFRLSRTQAPSPWRAPKGQVKPMSVWASTNAWVNDEQGHQEALKSWVDAYLAPRPEGSGGLAQSSLYSPAGVRGGSWHDNSKQSFASQHGALQAAAIVRNALGPQALHDLMALAQAYPQQGL